MTSEVLAAYYRMQQYYIEKLICFQVSCIVFACRPAKEESMDIILFVSDLNLCFDPVVYQGSVETAVINDAT